MFESFLMGPCCVWRVGANTHSQDLHTWRPSRSSAGAWCAQASQITVSEGLTLKGT